jgi:predicted type IV restriction endonuclease
LYEDPASTESYIVKEKNDAIDFNLKCLLENSLQALVTIAEASNEDIAYKKIQDVCKEFCKKQNRYPFDNKILYTFSRDELIRMTWNDYLHTQSTF